LSAEVLLFRIWSYGKSWLGVGGRGLVRERTEVMLPPAGSEARWREEVMPGRASGEVMLALTHQEAKTKQKEQAN